MPRVEVRLAELQNAASQFHTSASKIQESITTVQEVIDGITAVGYESPAAGQLVLRYRTQRSMMDEWLQQLQDFSNRLQEAADELEEAMTSQGIRAGHHTPFTPHHHRGQTPIVAQPEQQAPPVQHQVDDFVADVNSPLYSELAQKRHSIADAQRHVAELMQQRDESMDKLKTLEDRLRSFNRYTDLSAVPRVQVLRLEVEGLNADIATTQHNIADIQAQIAGLTIRLERVKPGPGADLALIHRLIGTQTPDWIKNSTEGCVNYITRRMAIPAGIPLDAHLWDEQAARFTQYGITRGNVPLPGSVLVLEREHSYADDVFGHLMYVEKVENGQVWVSDNFHPNEPVLLSDITTETSGPNMEYLYFPWQTRG
jgi:hypothetical protein